MSEQTVSERPTSEPSNREPPFDGLLMVCMVVWGLNLSTMKALTQYFDTMLLASLRMLVAVGVLGALVWWRHGAWPVLTRRQWGALALCALLMVYANQICFAGGMARSSAANSALIMALSPLASSLLAALAFGERLSWQRLLGVAAGFAGVAVVVLQRPGSALASAGWGDLMLVGGVFSFAAGGVIVQRVVRNLDPLVLSLVIYGLGTAMLVLHGVVEDPQRLQPQRLFPGAWPWAMVLFSAIGATALCNWVWNGAIGRLGVARASQYQYWVPIYGLAFAVLLLGEPLNAWYGLGLALVMGGTWLGTQGSR